MDFGGGRGASPPILYHCPAHPRFVSYHHLLGFFPHSPLLWRGPSPTVAAHRDPLEILSGLKAPLNQPVRAADARSHHPLVNTRPLSWNRNAWWRNPPPLLGSSPLVGWSRYGAWYPDTAVVWCRALQSCSQHASLQGNRARVAEGRSELG